MCWRQAGAINRLIEFNNTHLLKLLRPGSETALCPVASSWESSAPAWQRPYVHASEPPASAGEYFRQPSGVKSDRSDPYAHHNLHVLSSRGGPPHNSALRIHDRAALQETGVHQAAIRTTRVHKGGRTAAQLLSVCHSITFKLYVVTWLTFLKP